MIQHDYKSVRIVVDNKTAETNYDETLFKLIESSRWHKKSNYLFSNKYKLYLHQLVMQHWYGEDTFHKMKNKGYVIDHHDNDGLNCNIENLSFLQRNRNVAKGQVFDKNVRESRDLFCLNIFKDFKNCSYQIAIGFNKMFVDYLNDGKRTPVSRVYWIYDDDFLMVLQDADKIINDLITKKHIDLTQLRHKKHHFIEAFVTYLKPEEKGSAMVERNGELYFVQGTGKFKLIRLTPFQE